ncbi:uncharacterized protein VDAG_01747 [Verticillium dahliae VdLs.17]|uniref:Uncharacterized protein n=1 Tax=Verticillium dahliae (strain VdLs.17 / ATCC MYA-4575 / FGSC 10137) TaxID=498257 RepID=G2WVW1_VERDV|nr:uncharacterized protein VDAG_01747 [Verticillium dahliae VdLs.17]EGY19731.1 hypothetical protein VDAG_01747 [Verticillium dahliae VdLs.17]
MTRVLTQGGLAGLLSSSKAHTSLLALALAFALVLAFALTGRQSSSEPFFAPFGLVAECTPPTSRMIRSVLSLKLNNETLNHRPSGQGLPARPGVNPSVTHDTVRRAS